MRRHTFATLAVLTIVSLPPLATAQPTTPAATPQTTPDNQCGVCHPRERVEFERSVHAVESLSCVDCHGGDPRTDDVDRAHATKNFVTGKSRKDIPALCASCHADLERMQPFNLPTNQLALYQLSGHGRRLAKGDDRVAVCSDCHSSHGTRTSSDPMSPTHRRNLPATCGRCHDDDALMANYGGTRHPYAEYMKSTHALQLFEYGNPNAPVCSDCHGVHGAAPPDLGDIHRVCGRCHTTTRKYFDAGPHLLGMDQAGLPECSSCHGHHSVLSAPAGGFAICSDCHEDGSPALAIGQRIDVLVRNANDEIATADSLVTVAAEVPLAVADYEARLREARTYLTEVRPLSHSVAVEPVEDMTRRARSIAAEVESEIHGQLQDISVRKLGLLAFWFYVLLTIAVLLDVRRGRRSGSGGAS